MDEKLILGTNFKFHHSALCRGYVRINEGYAEDYSGRFGIGKKIHHPKIKATMKMNTNGEPRQREMYL